MRRLTLKAVVAGATMTPVTQMLAACALSAVIVLALWQSTSGGATVGSFVAFITAMLMLVAPIKHLSDVMAPITRGLAAVERGMDLIEQSPREQGGRHAAAQPAHARAATSAYEGVTLRYRDDTRAGAGRTSRCRCAAARRWRWSGPRAPASRRW